MDPISLGLSAVGLGMQIFGGLGQASVAKQSAQVSANIATQEQAVNQQKQEQMNTQARRMQLENVRNAQRGRAQATASAVSQGSSAGMGMQSSALSGGLADVTNQSTFNAQGVNNSLQFGNTIAGYNNNISADKIQLANLGGQAATDQGISSLGGALMKSGPTVGGFAKDLGGASSSSSGGMFFQSGPWTLG